MLVLHKPWFDSNENLDALGDASCEIYAGDATEDGAVEARVAPPARARSLGFYDTDAGSRKIGMLASISPEHFTFPRKSENEDTSHACS